MGVPDPYVPYRKSVYVERKHGKAHIDILLLHGLGPLGSSLMRRHCTKIYTQQRQQHMNPLHLQQEPCMTTFEAEHELFQTST